MIKIAYIAEGMYNNAGMERVLSIRANALCDKFDITFITFDDGSEEEFFKLDKRIKRIYLNSGNKGYKQKLKKVLLENKYDITVSTGGMEFFCLHDIKDGSKKIFEFHFSYDISKVWIGQRPKGLLGYVLIKLQTWKRIYHARKYDQIVVLSKTDSQKWKRYCKNVVHIYNPLTIMPKISDCTSKNVIAVGRLNYQKGFDYLIDTWNIVYKKHPDWTLNIYGDGDKRKELQEQIDRLNLSKVVTLQGKTDHIADKYAESSIFVLSSRDEAFGLVITEAEACGLPIVTFACPSAPAELVDDGMNGYVVNRVGDIETFASRISELIENDDLRKKQGIESVELAKKFNINMICEKWKHLYFSILAKVSDRYILNF